MFALRGFPAINQVIKADRTSPKEGAALLLEKRITMRMLFRILSVVACCLVVGAASLAHGQSTFGSIRGTVQDATGAGIPGTQIVLHSTEENTDRTVSSSESGDFILENVKPGS